MLTCPHYTSGDEKSTISKLHHRKFRQQAQKMAAPSEAAIRNSFRVGIRNRPFRPFHLRRQRALQVLLQECR